MPIRILSLPPEDLRYALNCMDICDLIAFSLCSKRTKNLVKNSNRTVGNISAKVDESGIRFEMSLLNFPLRGLRFLLDFSNPWLKLKHQNGINYWMKQGFTQSDWVPHFLSIFDGPIVEELEISDVCSIDYLDNVKQIIPQCKTLKILEDCSKELIRAAFNELLSIAEEVEIIEYRFDNGNDISKFLTMNLKSLSLIDWSNPLKLNLDDLLVTNITDLSIELANITEKEIKRFLKLWMKGNHTFYRPKIIKLRLSSGIEINREEVLRGIKYEIARYYTCAFRLKRKDGKELLVFMARQFIDFRFA